jgi:N-acetyl-anhydromuramyl-L-alanine amidase AmpD
MNRKSIGICCIGNFDNNPPPNSAWSMLLKLCANISLRYDISVENVKGHSEYAPYKSCPGKAFDMVKFRKDLETELN